jgi:anhydro-N-acetylmuramic acid kinase
MRSLTVLTAIGVASDASVDGIRLALVKTDGRSIIEHGPTRFSPYSRDLKIFIRRAVKAAQEGRDGAADIGKASGEITQAIAIAIDEFLDAERLRRTAIDVVGLDGHMLVHQPRKDSESIGRSWRIGDGKTLAEDVRIDVVTNFRDADIAAGGDAEAIDAPYLAALVRLLEPEGPVGVIDAGEAVRLLIVPAEENDFGLLAFDSGPGLRLIDEWRDLKGGTALDSHSDAARSGKVHADLLRMMLLNPYLRRKPPKKIDRTTFKLDPILPLSAPDGAATLTAFAAACVRSGVSHLDEAPLGWAVIGEGRRNSALMEALAKALESDVRDAESLGWRGDFLAAEAAGYLAVRALRKIPYSFPKTTRVPRPVWGGIFHRAPA